MSDQLTRHADSCEFMTSDNPWSPCTCGFGRPGAVVVKAESKPLKLEAVSNIVRTTRNEDGSGGFLVAECSLLVGGAAERARLFAAAPELLEALQAITDQLERIGDTRPHKDGQFIEAAREAISKARGEL
jgi:hypothetical protein